MIRIRMASPLLIDGTRPRARKEPIPPGAGATPGQPWVSTCPGTDLLKFPSTVISLVLLFSVLAAQTRGALTTLSNYGNYAAQGSAVAFKTIKAGTAIPAGRTVSVSATIPARVVS